MLSPVAFYGTWFFAVVAVGLLAWAVVAKNPQRKLAALLIGINAICGSAKMATQSLHLYGLDFVVSCVACVCLVGGIFYSVKAREAETKVASLPR